MLLVLDTCTERLIAGVRGPEGDRWLNTDSQGNHARDLLPAIGSLLEGARPDAVGVALGPGSFTGVRIGLATAKGLAEGWNAPLFGLDNLEAMADAWSRLLPASQAAVLTIIDARKQKFYGALYRGNEVLLEPADRSAAQWMDLVRQVWPGEVAVSGYQGSVFAAAADVSPWTVLDTHDWTPGLLDQLEKNRTGKPLEKHAAPRYLRLSEAEENKMRLG